MSDQPKWMPSRETFLSVVYGLDPMKPEKTFGQDTEAVGNLLRAAVEKALAEQEARHRREVIEARRATLEEAARAVCVGCDSTDKLFNDGVAWMHRDESPGYEGPYYRCVASKIHDLIAALDKEGS